MPSQDVPEPLGGEADLVSVPVDEAAHAGLHHRIPYRKVYRLPAYGGNTLCLNSTVILLAALHLQDLRLCLFPSDVGAHGDPRPDAQPPLEGLALPGGVPRHQVGRRLLRLVAVSSLSSRLLLSVAVSHVVRLQRRVFDAAGLSLVCFMGRRRGRTGRMPAALWVGSSSPAPLPRRPRGSTGNPHP